MVATLFFSVRDIRGALPLDDSMFLVRMAKPGPFPEKGPGIIGGLNLDGSIIPIYSFRILFGIPDRPPRITDNLIVTKVGRQYVALWVDDTNVVQNSDLSLNNHAESLVEIPDRGLIILPDGVVFLFDLNRFLLSHGMSTDIPVSQIIYQNHPALESDLPLSGDVDYQDPLDVDSILTERAEELARPREKPQEVSSIEVLTFQLVYREYAVELKYVRESVLSREITPVPGTPDYVIGVLPVRGEIIPLIDLRVLLRIPETGLTDLNHVIILTNGGITFGILADQITGITMIPWNEIDMMRPDKIPGKPDYVLGIANDSLVVINAAEILADPDMIVDDSGEQKMLLSLSQQEKQ